MKITFREFTLGDTVNVEGRRQLVKGEEVEVTRLEVEAFIATPKAPGFSPMTSFTFWLKNGKKYSVMLAGEHIFPVEPKEEAMYTPDGKEIEEFTHGAADNKAIREKTT